MNIKAMLAAASLAALTASPGFADDKPLFVYVSPGPIGVDDVSETRQGRHGAGRQGARRRPPRPTRAPIRRPQRQNLEAAAKAGAKIVVAIGFEFDDMLPEVATAYPKVKFLQIDSLPVQEHEAEHLLLGVPRIRGELSDRRRGRADHQDRQGRRDQRARYSLPASLHRRLHRGRQACHAATSRFRRRSGSAAPIRSRIPRAEQERAAAMLADGADRILAAGAGSNGGIFKAMQDSPGAFAFGVDVNQCPQAPGFVMDNVEKKTDVAVELAIKGIVGGERSRRSPRSGSRKAAWR